MNFLNLNFLTDITNFGGSDMRKCKHIIWCTNGRGTFGIGVFEDEYGKREIRGSFVNGHDEKTDIQTIDEWGGRIDPASLVEILALM